MKNAIRVAVFLGALLVTVVAPARGVAGDSTIDVIATTFPVHLITAVVIDGDPGVKLDLLLAPSLGCPHDYVLTPADMRRAATADVIVTNGLGLDDFIDDLVGNRKDGGPLIVDSSRGLRGIMEYTEEHHDDDGHDDHHECEGRPGHGAHDAHGGHHHEGANPHIFASPLMAASMALNIARQLGAARPSMARRYQANATAFMSRMTVLDAEFKVAVSRLKNRRIVTQHGIFDYLARDAGLEIVAVIQTHPGTEPSASEMLTLVKEIRAAGAGAVFAEPQYRLKMPAALALEAGIPMGVMDPVANGPAGAGPDYYEKTMRANIAVLEKYLGTR